MRDGVMRVSILRDLSAVGRPLLAGLFMLGLTSCSATSMDEAAQAPADGSAAAIPPPATDETFPNLGSVPDEAPAVPSAAERQTVIEGLSADRANAQYTDQELTGNVAGASVAPPEPAPPPEVISTEPPPAAAPIEPVEAAPVTPSEAAPASELPAESEPVAETAPAPDPSSAAAAEVISPTAEAAPEPPAPAAEPFTQASSAMTAPPPAAPAQEAIPAPPPPDPAPIAAPADPVPEPAPVASIASAPVSAAPPPPPSAPSPSTSSLPMPGQPGTVVPPVSTNMPATLPPPSPAPAAPAITAEPVPPPMQAPSAAMPAAMPAMPPPTSVASVVPSGPFPYPQATSRPATYASGAVTVDMSALDGSSASYYSAAMSNAYAPLPAAPSYAQPAAYSPGAGAGGPSGLIYFGEGAAGLDAGDREVLKSVAAIYRQRGGYIRLLGHASQDGGRATGFEAQQANLQLSWARANAVARELARQGVDPGAIETGAVGDSQPLYVESTTAAEAANRRVEIYILN